MFHSNNSFVKIFHIRFPLLFHRWTGLIIFIIT